MVENTICDGVSNVIRTGETRAGKILGFPFSKFLRKDLENCTSLKMTKPYRPMFTGRTPERMCCTDFVHAQRESHVMCIFHGFCTDFVNGLRL